jgi:hypothetical protein
VVRGFAALALVTALVVGACGGSGDDETDSENGATDASAQRGGDDNGNQTDSGGASQPEAADGEGYPDQVRRNFMNACTAQPGATETQCECTFDEIAETVPVEDFVAYDQAVRQDPATPPPGWIEAAIAACI